MLNPERSLNRSLSDRIAGLRALDPIANAAQAVVRQTLAIGGVPLRNALSGTWLGHPLHPALTDIPVGAWTVAAILDALALVGSDAWAPGADAALIVGIAGAAAAANSGWADWSDTADEPKRLGIAHAALNGGALLLYVASLAARRTGRRPAGIALAMGGYGVMSFASFLGGELSFGMQLGTRHTAIPIEPPRDFTSVMDESALETGKMARTDLNGIPIVLLRTVAGVFAIGAACTHRGAPLDEGEREGDCVRCPWHGSLFSFVDGSVVEGPASFPQPRFETRTRDGRIEVRALAHP